MSISWLQIFAALVMLAAAIALVLAYRGYLVAGSERRMRNMLEHVGLDPTLAANGDTDTLVNEIRRRCQTCSAESVCELWPADEMHGDNSFCPNAEVFEEIRKNRRAAA